jgi:hypothetical protein
MATKLVETTISGSSIRLRFADESNPEFEWMHFQVPISELKEPNQQNSKLDEPELQYLAELQLAVLQYVRHAINAEIQRLAAQAGRTA